MKKKSLAMCILLLCGSLVPYYALAADNDGTTNDATNSLTLAVTGSALLQIVTGQSFNMSLGGASIAGAEVKASSTNSTARLRMSSVVDGTTTRTITALINKDLSLYNTELLVNFETPTTAFFNPANIGTVNKTATALSTSTAVSCVTGIKTCWSGIEADCGYPITYTFKPIDSAVTYSTPGAVVITYTISE
jgi:hypothetical protein